MSNQLQLNVHKRLVRVLSIAAGQWAKLTRRGSTTAECRPSDGRVCQTWWLVSDPMALSIEEREQFLAEPHIGALSVVERPDRAPLTVPIWYQYSPGGELWVLTAPGARKTRAIDAAGRFSLMVQRTAPTIRYVS